MLLSSNREVHTATHLTTTLSLLRERAFDGHLHLSSFDQEVDFLKCVRYAF